MTCMGTARDHRGNTRGEEDALTQGVECLGSIRMLTADGKVLTGWLASQTDMLSEDWCILKPAKEWLEMP